MNTGLPIQKTDRKNKDQEEESFKEQAATFKDSAFPTDLEFHYQSQRGLVYRSTSKGLSKREWFAGMAIIGLSSANQLSEYESSKIAVIIADKVIEELNKKKDLA